MIEGIIFDFNGTLFCDSNEHELAWKDTLGDICGRDIASEEFENYVHGRTNDKILKYFLGAKATKENIEYYSKVKEKRYRELCLKRAEGFNLSPGAEILLDYLRERNIKRTIATASQLENLLFYREKLHLDRWFEFKDIVFDDGTFKGKPEPDIYKLSLKRIDVRAENAAIVEDAISGLISAKRANIGKLIAVCFDNNYAKFENISGIDIIVENLSDIISILE